MSRNQNFKSYGRGKHSNHPNTVVHSSIQFDKFFCENSNKPTAAKSAGTIGKWGITSFTSIRSSNFSVGSKETSRFSSLGKKRSQPVADNGMQIKRPVLNNNAKRECSPILPTRKFFKSRNSLDDPNQKSYKSSNAAESRKVGKHSRSVDENKKQKHALYEENKPKNVSVVRTFEKPVKVSTKKVPPLKIVDESVTSSENFRNLQNFPSPPKERDKPPIVLRIFKGTSQLITETKSDANDECTEVNSFVEDNQAKSKSVEPVSNESINNVETAAVLSRSLRRRSREKSKSPSPEPLVPVKISRRLSEKSKSLSPDPAAAPKTKSTRRRSPEKSKSPSPEPTITTRSLRRRPTPVEPPPLLASSAPVPPPHTSPKRALRSTKNTPPTPPPAAGKIVITNLNSNHPSVYINEPPTGPTAALPLINKKEVKECRSYSGKHKHKQSNKHETVKSETTDASLKQVEEILADINCAPSTEVTAIPEVDEVVSTSIEPAKITDTSLDSDRAELLHLLEDDDEEENVPETNGSKETASNIIEAISESDSVAPVMEEISPSIISSESSELKIKIKISDLRKPSIEAKTKEEDVLPLSQTNDSADSGICVKSELEYTSANSTEWCSKPDSEPKNSLDETKDIDDRLTDIAANSDSEMRSELGSESSSSTMPAAVTNKKGSIFKHRSTNDGNKKRLALYKHKWVDDKDGGQTNDEDKSGQTNLDKLKTLDSIFDDAEIDDMPLTKFIRQPAENKFDFDEAPPVMGVKCAKKNKDFYTVVRNVKKAHQIQESGEFQEFNDDVEYILDALQDNNAIGLRCLSAITLATKCTEPAFRMHVRAHGTVTKFFRALHDATKDQSLGLCTATVMFVLSQDRLNMDLDRDSLELMLNLLESDASHTQALEDCGLTDSQLTKTRDKVRQICADIQAQGHAKHLNLDNITVGHLSMETLLSLTSKRAGEWFKEELRELGGLEHIIKTVVECCKHVDDTANAWSATSLEKIRKVNRCLRVLENVTMQNEQNNDYLIVYQNGILIDTLVRMYKVCDYEIPLYPTCSIDDKESTGAVLRECLIANLKVLINITHDYQNKCNGSSVIGSRPGVIESSLHVLLQIPQYIPKEEKFDLMLLTLILLINLVEHCNSNRKAIIEAKAPSDEESIFETKAREPAVKALVSMFYNYEELARNEEKKTDAILEGENTEKPPNNAPQKAHEEFIEETISQLVQKAGQNMEHTLIAAYVAMTIGYLIIDNEEFEKFVRNHLPEKNFQFMISVLQKFYTFMTLTASGGTVSNRGMKSIQMVINKLNESDRRFGFDPQTASNSETQPARCEDTNQDCEVTLNESCESLDTSGASSS